MVDWVVRNALIVDGTGRAPFMGSIAVNGERIVEVIKESDAHQIPSSTRVIDAQQRVIMPGIIDTHTHYDAQITWDRQLRPSSSLGVSTVLIGLCGFTIAPCRPSDRDLNMRHLTQVEGMSLAALEAGIDWQFETFPEYLDFLERRGSVLNVGAFIGHSSLRTWAMGEAATERAANAQEVAKMAAATREAMAAGAVGFASSTAAQHNGFGGVPMPSRLADDDEFMSLLAAMGEQGRGIFMLTKGDRTSVPFLERLSEHSTRPVMIAALLHNPTVPEGIFADLAAINGARTRGRELYGQVSCCPLTNEFTLESAYPFEGLDAWKPAMRVAGDALRQLLLDADFRRAVRAELDRPMAVRLFNNQWDQLSIVQVADPQHASLEGRTVAELAAQEDKHPLDWMLDFSLQENLQTLFIARLLNTDEQAVARALTDENASIALSDAGAHLTFFCDAGFGLHLLGHWWRERQVFTLEQAVHHLTGRPAAIYRIAERGCIGPGCYADLLLIDPATVGRAPSRRVFDLPDGGARLTTDPVGVHGLWVNGEQVADENGVLDDVPNAGRVLREFA